jgi:hypothetical protein
VLDPDGNTVLLGQEERSASQPLAADDENSPWSSLLQEAAVLVQARGGTTADCQVRDTVWACLRDADEILVTVPGAFLASQEDQGPGIAEFLRSRRS